MAQSSRAGTALLVTALAAVCAGLAALLYVAVQPRHGIRSDEQPLPVSTSVTPTACAGPTVRLLTASAFAPVLRAVARSLGTGAGCVVLDVRVANGRAAAAQAGSVDAWVPDDAAWRSTAPRGVLADAGTADSGELVGASPLYLATTDGATRQALVAAGSSWRGTAGLLGKGGTIRLAVRDPQMSGDGLVALGALATSVWQPATSPRAADLAALTVHDAFGRARTVPAGPAWPRSGEVGVVAESALLTDPARAKTVQILGGLDHSALLRYTWLPAARAVHDATLKPALARVFTALHGLVAAQARRAAGLRGPDLLPVGITPKHTVKPFAVLSARRTADVYAAWDTEDRAASLLLAVDVSGSMRDPFPGTKTPIIDYVRAECRSSAALLPDDAALGLWKFGAALREAGGADYLQLLGLARLGGHRVEYDSAVTSLAAENTGTGLYDSTLAAYRYAQQHYRAGRPNTVVIVTDGVNQDDPRSISLSQLGTSLQAAADPKRPVRLIIAAVADSSDAQPLATALAPIHGRVAELAGPRELHALFVHVATGGGD